MQWPFGGQLTRHIQSFNEWVPEIGRKKSRAKGPSAEEGKPRQSREIFTKLKWFRALGMRLARGRVLPSQHLIVLKQTPHIDRRTLQDFAQTLAPTLQQGFRGADRNPHHISDLGIRHVLIIREQDGRPLLIR